MARTERLIGASPERIFEVLVVEAPHRLDLKAKARPLGTAIVSLRLQRRGGGTLVTMIEDAGDPLTRLVFNPLTHLLVRGRNAESLRPLGELAVGTVDLRDVPH